MGRELDERTPLLVDVNLAPSSLSRAGGCGPDGWVTRITALLLMSFIGFGAFFCYDNPGALQSEVRPASD